jgi:hypothetical protein
MPSLPGVWPGQFVMIESDEDEIRLAIAVGVLEREAAKSELAGMGINASPADVSAWIALSGKAQRQACLDYAVMMAAG